MNLYVSNLGFQVTDDDLKNLFVTYGNVTSARVIKDKFSGQSRGFGFVEMANEGEGKKAMEGLEGKDMEGRKISVTVARPKEDKGNSFQGGRGSRW